MIEVRSFRAWNQCAWSHAFDCDGESFIRGAQLGNAPRYVRGRQRCWSCRCTTVNSTHYMLVVNMMCAFGVPGNINHGPFSDDLAESPVLSSVANGM